MPDFDSIDFTGLPDTEGLDLSGLPDTVAPKIPLGKSEIPVLREAPSIGMAARAWDGAMQLFENPQEESAKAVQALVDSEALGIPPSSAFRLQDAISRGVEINPQAARKRSTVMERLVQSKDIGVKQNQIGELGYRFVMDGDPSWLKEMDNIGMPTPENIFVSETRIEDAFRSAAKLLPMTIDSAREAGVKGVTLGMLFGTAAAFAGQPELIPFAVGAGLKIGGVEGFFESALRKEAGLAAWEMTQFEDEDGNKIDHRIVRAASFGIGAINAGLELAEMKVLMKTIPGLNKLLSETILETATSKTVRRKLLKLASLHVTTTAKETAIEVAQESNNIVFEEIAKKANNLLKGTDIKPTDLAHVLGRLYETGKESAQGMAVIAAPGIIAQVPSAVSRPSKAKIKAEVTRTKDILVSLGVEEVEAGDKAVEVVEGATLADLVPTEEMVEPAAPTAEDIAADEAAIDMIIEGTDFDTLTDEEATDSIIDRVIEGEELDTLIEAVEAPVSPVEVEGIPEGGLEAKQPVDGLISAERREQLEAEYLATQEIKAETDKLLNKLRSGKVPTEPLSSIQKAEKANLDALEQVLDEVGVGLELSNEEIKATIKGEDTEAVRKATGTIKGIKGQIRRATGIVKSFKMIRENKALAAAWKKAEQSAKVAFREGNREGVAIERDRLKGISAEAKSRVEATTKVGKLKNRILKEIKTAKAKKRGGKPFGKYTADVQNILDRFIKAVKLSQEEAMDKISENLDKYIGKDMPDSVLLENRVLDMIVRLRYRAGELGAPPLRKRFTVGELETLLAGIKDMKAGGKALAEFVKLNRTIEDDKRVGAFIDSLMGGKEFPKGMETTGLQKVEPSIKELKKWLQNFTGSLGVRIVGWNDLMNMLSGRDTTAKTGEGIINKIAEVHTQENLEKAGRRKAVTAIADIARAAFGFVSDMDMLTQFNLDRKPMEIGHFNNAKGVGVDLVMTKAEARKFIMEYSDPALRETFHVGMNFTEEMVQAVRATLTKQDLDFIQKQLEFYRTYYDRVNAVYREAYGVDLPFNEFYSPIKREGFVESEGLHGAFLDEVSYRRSVGSPSLKARVANLNRISLQSDIAVLERHVAEMEHFIAWSEKVRQLNSVFKNPKVRAAINLHHSKTMLAVIDRAINHFTQGGVDTANRLNWLDKFRGRFTRSVLAVKPVIAIKQLVSTMAYMEVMPVTDFAAGVFDFWKSPIKAVKFLKKNSIWFAERGTNMERDIKTAMRMKEYSAYRKTRGFMDSLMLNVTLGDQGAIAIGGWSYYKYLTEKKGMSHEKAIVEFEKFSEVTQQSADLSVLSDFQRGTSVQKLFSMFLSSPNLYVRKEMGAIRNLLGGKGSKVDQMKTLLIYHIILPSLFQLVSDGFSWDKDNQKRAVVLGPLNGIFIIGEAIEYLVSKALGVRAFGKEVALYGAVDDLGKAMTEAMRYVFEGNLTDEEMWRGIRSFASAVGAATGLPLKQLVDQLKTGSDFIDGEYEKALKGATGYPPYVIEKQDKKGGFKIQ